MSRPFFRNNLPVIALSLLLLGAAGPARQPAAGKEPVVITSRRMEADRMHERIVFSGDVTLKKEDITLTADSLIVFYDEATKGVREMEALGSVVVRRDNRVALAQRALYTSRDEKIVLTGDARIIENDNQLGGDRITLFVREERSIVEGGKVLFYQDKGEKKDK